MAVPKNPIVFLDIRIGKEDGEHKVKSLKHLIILKI